MPLTYPGSRTAIRQSYLRRHFPEIGIDPILQSITTKTMSQYDIVFKKWWAFNSQNHSDPFDYNLHNVITFLSQISHSGCSFSNINTHKSALTLLLNFKEQDQNMIKRFIKGLYNINPPKPRYNTTWDPYPVLVYLSKWHPLNTLSIKQLTFKVTVLLALISAQRLQTLSKINIDHINVTSENLQIFIPDRLKTSGKNKTQPVLIIPFFTQNPEWCLASAIIEYIKITSFFRPIQIKKLFLTIKKPIHAASAQTISHWIKNILHECGIDTTIFTGYSSRHAATSAAHRGGINIESIRKAAGWSSKSEIFAKFYNKSILPDPSAFAKSVFKGSNISLV